jgi:hypothetical protein
MQEVSSPNICNTISSPEQWGTHPYSPEQEEFIMSGFKYRPIINDLGDKKLVYFRNGYRHKHQTILKHHRNSKFIQRCSVCAPLITLRTSVRYLILPCTPQLWLNHMWNSLSKGLWHRRLVYTWSFIYFFFSFSWWGETESTWYVGHCCPIVPAPDDRGWWLWSSWWNEDWQGKPKYSEKTCPTATLSTTNPTRPDLGSNPGRRGGKPATNRLSYGTALSYTLHVEVAWSEVRGSRGPINGSCSSYPSLLHLRRHFSLTVIGAPSRLTC